MGMKVEIKNLYGMDLSVGNPDAYGRAFTIPKKGMTLELSDSEYLHTLQQLNALQSQHKIFFKAERVPEGATFIKIAENDLDRAKREMEEAQNNLKRKEEHLAKMEKAAKMEEKLTAEQEKEEAVKSRQVELEAQKRVE